MTSAKDVAKTYGADAIMEKMFDFVASGVGEQKISLHLPQREVMRIYSYVSYLAGHYDGVLTWEKDDDRT